MTETQPIRLLLVDDHSMFRESIARMLEKEPDLVVVGQAISATEALEQIGAAADAPLPKRGLNKAALPDVVLLDVDLGPERAVDFVTRARASGFHGKVLIVTAGMSDQEAIQLIQAGVAGIVHKHHSTGILCAAIRQIAQGEAWLEKTYLGPLFRTVERTRLPRRPALTERDKTVMRFLLQGLTNREMAAHLEVSEGAVKASLRHVCEKLGVRTRTQLVKVALEQFKDQL